MTIILPLKDQYTTYNYEIGSQRIQDIQLKNLTFSRYTEPDDATSFLVVFKSDKVVDLLPYMSRKTTKKFAKRHYRKWGYENTEKVLSATKTGSLYFHIIYHYGKFADFESEVEPWHPLNMNRLL